MNLKRRRQRWALYRSRWVPRTSSVPHGYSVQEYIGSIAIDAELVPDKLRGKLTPAEIAIVEHRVCAPARSAQLEKAAEASRLEQDPGWRLDKAAELIAEAAALSNGQAMQVERIRTVQTLLAAVHVESTHNGASNANRPGAMRDALSAIREAARAVREGSLGTAPATGARTTETYSLWSQIVEALEGPGAESLLTALQLQGFVKRRRL